MLTDKQIEREKVFCYDWYVTRKMDKTPTYADAIVWADKTMIEKACQWMKKQVYQEYGGGPLERLIPDERIAGFRKAMLEEE